MNDVQCGWNFVSVDLGLVRGSGGGIDTEILAQNHPFVLECV